MTTKEYQMKKVIYNNSEFLYDYYNDDKFKISSSIDSSVKVRFQRICDVITKTKTTMNDEIDVNKMDKVLSENFSDFYNLMFVVESIYPLLKIKSKKINKFSIKERNILKFYGFEFMFKTYYNVITNQDKIDNFFRFFGYYKDLGLYKDIEDFKNNNKTKNINQVIKKYIMALINSVTFDTFGLGNKSEWFFKRFKENEILDVLEYVLRHEAHYIEMSIKNAVNSNNEKIYFDILTILQKYFGKDYMKFMFETFLENDRNFEDEIKGFYGLKGNVSKKIIEYNSTYYREFNLEEKVFDKITKTFNHNGYSEKYYEDIFEHSLYFISLLDYGKTQNKLMDTPKFDEFIVRLLESAKNSQFYHIDITKLFKHLKKYNLEKRFIEWII